MSRHKCCCQNAYGHIYWLLKAIFSNKFLCFFVLTGFSMQAATYYWHKYFFPHIQNNSRTNINKSQINSISRSLMSFTNAWNTRNKYVWAKERKSRLNSSSRCFLPCGYIDTNFVIRIIISDHSCFHDFWMKLNCSKQ